MQRLTYQQAYDKIIQAYFRDEIKPKDSCFCFCGNLCDNSNAWHHGNGFLNHKPSHGYSGKELIRMEVALMFNSTLMEEYGKEGSKEYEDALFIAMCAALEVLKQIHKERGEDVDGVPEFTKRNLSPQTIQP